jgi:hypothetical protein
VKKSAILVLGTSSEPFTLIRLLNTAQMSATVGRLILHLLVRLELDQLSVFGHFVVKQQSFWCHHENIALTISAVKCCTFETFARLTVENVARVGHYIGLVSFRLIVIRKDETLLLRIGTVRKVVTIVIVAAQSLALMRCQVDMSNERSVVLLFDLDLRIVKATIRQGQHELSATGQHVVVTCLA